VRLRASDVRPVDSQQIALRCPECHKTTIPIPIGQDWTIGEGYICGQRRCPDPQCNGHVFIVLTKGEVVASYPPSRAEFNPESIPNAVRKSFEEALDCHAHGYNVAAAIMIRRTLEDVCHDRDAKGDDLKARIGDLRTKIVIPQELLDGMDELRILGNDAAHVNAIAFLSITKIELDVAIQFTAELLKSLYQYSSLLQKLRALKAQGSA